ncbi:hypothetical protein [Neobacillus notoginsengisoli]|uniref:hypothetical protein n=1 Tax=Neobacillus notoginsengisoli TaxID=1578198 RepID=UPI001F00C1E7|nr:hypothetical protein [Neobacillus notoginsengisoli]
MIYRYCDVEKELDQVSAYLFTPNKSIVERHAVCTQDDYGYWFMCFVEEYEQNEANKAKKEVQLQ